jgi:large subunit ribosomal protein L35
MPKMKTHKGLKKRVKVTARGKVKTSRSSFTGHLLSGRPAKRRRKLRQGSVISESFAPRMKRALGE